RKVGGGSVIRGQESGGDRPKVKTYFWAFHKKGGQRKSGVCASGIRTHKQSPTRNPVLKVWQKVLLFAEFKKG
ncbi:MAG: hypothetical protein LBG61_02885, partial [Burkholderiales bacterium]|nr:hypothetical protein [Burkholderiales bacterium]